MPHPRPTETALKGRARTLLEAMTARTRWIYAIPRDDGPAAVRAIAEEAGFRREDEDAAAGAARYVAANASLVTLDSAELDVMLIEAAGEEAAAVLAKILDRAGFYAQSTLLGAAHDIHDPEAPKALRTLAHMIVAWDEDWSDLFLLHLASPDAVVRHDAVVALTVAVMVARDAGPAPALLDEAIAREKFPKLKETMTEALNVVRGIAGQPVEIKA